MPNRPEVDVLFGGLIENYKAQAEKEVRKELSELRRIKTKYTKITKSLSKYEKEAKDKAEKILKNAKTEAKKLQDQAIAKNLTHLKTLESDKNEVRKLRKRFMSVLSELQKEFAALEKIKTMTGEKFIKEIRNKTYRSYYDARQVKALKGMRFPKSIPVSTIRSKTKIK